MKTQLVSRFESRFARADSIELENCFEMEDVAKALMAPRPESLILDQV